MPPQKRKESVAFKLENEVQKWKLKTIQTLKKKLNGRFPLTNGIISQISQYLNESEKHKKAGRQFRTSDHT